MKRTLAALTALYALPVAADEVWSTPAGQIIYETVLDGGMAVFSMPAQPLMYDATAGATGWVYIPDLANADGVRSFHEAFWIVEGMQFCPMAMVVNCCRPSARTRFTASWQAIDATMPAWKTPCNGGRPGTC